MNTGAGTVRCGASNSKKRLTSVRFYQAASGIGSEVCGDLPQRVDGDWQSAERR